SRIVKVRGWVQAHPPARIEAVWLRQKYWVLRELQPREDRLDLEEVTQTPGALPEIVADMGRALASVHLRGCGRKDAGPERALRDWVRERWRKPLLGYAEAYVAKVEDDWKAWRARKAKDDPDRPLS